MKYNIYLKSYLKDNFNKSIYCFTDSQIKDIENTIDFKVYAFRKDLSNLTETVTSEFKKDMNVLKEVFKNKEDLK